ncbi:FtsX-like permease family protein [Candidatus Parcubacteria bacterium]|nr:MAG: FtsX-like permease family protein [Candidatus Parcubacteria bacterium]
MKWKARHLIELLALDVSDAWADLQRRPMRSLLGGLGIGIGIAALIAMMSIGASAEQKSLQKIRSLGLQTIRIENAMNAAHLTDPASINLSRGLSLEDMRTLAHSLTYQARVAAFVRRDHAMVAAETFSASATLLGVTLSWQDIEGLQTTWGRRLWPEDLHSARQSCVLGHAIAIRLHAQTQTLLRVENIPCLVVGILKPHERLLTEGTGLSTLDFDHAIIMPLSAWPFSDNADHAFQPLSGIVVKLHSKEASALYAAAKKARMALRRLHNNVKDYRIVIPRNLLHQAQETQRLFSMVLGAIAALSLLVGGISIMNVMLANISEQTREIGLRMAVGASPARTITLYLIHSIFLCLAGCLWGMAVGVLLAAVIQFRAGWNITFSIPGMFLAPTFALITGLIFGAYPAFRASTLNPAQALRDS